MQSELATPAPCATILQCIGILKKLRFHLNEYSIFITAHHFVTRHIFLATSVLPLLLLLEI